MAGWPRAPGGADKTSQNTAYGRADDGPWPGRVQRRRKNRKTGEQINLRGPNYSMASAGARAYRKLWGLFPQWGLGAKTLVRVSGEVPLKLTIFLTFEKPNLTLF